jgi:hypothetical protein
MIIIALIGLVGCPGQDGSAGPVDTCQKAGQQCRIGGGQLGVCVAKTGQELELECASQH